jgi:hypothetical protein
MITEFKIFENKSNNELKNFASLFHKKICEYGNVVGKTFADIDDYEIEFIEDNEKYIFTIILKNGTLAYDEITLKSSLFNDSLCFTSVVDYFKNSEFFKLISGEDYDNYYYIYKFEIIGSLKEIEEDLKNLEIIIQANKYNL